MGMSGTMGGANALLNDPSSMSIKTKLGLNDGIRSTRAFLTSVTPARNGEPAEPNLAFAGDHSPTSSAKNHRSARKVFGA